MTIIRSALTGLSWSASATLFKGVIQFVQLIILARFLTPIELGALAIINLVIGLAQIFGDAGISNALIYYKSLNKNQLNQLYLINISLGILVSMSVGLLAYPIALFFDMNQLTHLLVFLAPVFFIRSLSQQHMALLQQKLKFDSLAKVEVLASTLSFMVLMFLLSAEFRLEAVIYAQLTGASALTLLILCFYSFPLPKFAKIDFSSIIAPIKYGLYQTGEGAVNYISAQFDQLLIGKFLGAETLGIYSYIKALVFRPALEIINPIINRVTFPLMVNFKKQHAISDMYSHVLSLLSLINIPLYLLVASFPELVLKLTFGESWLIHAELLKWLALYMLVISLMNPIGVLLKATGNVKRGFWWNIFVTLVRPTLIVLSISYGVVWLVKVLVIAQVCLYVLHWYFLIKPVINLSLVSLLKTLFLPLGAFIVSFLLVFALKHNIEQLNDYYAFGFMCLSYCLLISPALFNIVKLIRK